MSVIDASWNWAPTYGGVGAILTDSTEIILRHLSVEYLDRARAQAADAFEETLDREVELEPVTFYSADNNWFPDINAETRELLPDYDRWSPFSGVGWLARGVHEAELLTRGEALPERGRSLCLALIRGEPSLALCGGGRFARPTPVPAVPGPPDASHQLAALLHDTDADGSSWVPVGSRSNQPPGPAASEPSTLWERARAAADRGEADTLLHLLGDARQRYSSPGWRLLRSGTLHLLALRQAGWLR
jgi:hypothetical protein